MTTHTSRRAVLAGTAALPIAAAVIAPALAETEDAELVRLAAEVKAAYEAFCAVLDALAIAEARKSGLDEVRAAEAAASDKLSDALDLLCEVPAHTLSGLITKARTAEIDQDAIGGQLADSIVDDLLAMEGV